MKLEDQLAYVGACRKLKELGVIQDGYLSWMYDPLNHKYEISPLKVEALELLAKANPKDRSWKEKIEKGIFSAFSVAELGVMLKGENTPFYWEMWKEWCFKENGQPRGYGTEATARAEYLIHLLKSNHITTEEINKRLTE